MRSVSRGLAALGALILVVGGYLTADVFDIVPGVFTSVRTSAKAGIATAPTPGSSPTVQVTLVPIPSAAVSAAAPLLAPAEAATMPTRAGMTAALARALADAGLGSSVRLTVRDARTWPHLLDVSAQVPRIPASTVNLLTAAPILSAPDPGPHVATPAVACPRDGPITAALRLRRGAAPPRPST